MKRSLVLAIALAVCPAGAWADDVADCNSGKADLAISGCSKLIDSKGLTKKDRAAAYYSRGIAYQLKGDLEAAIADYAKAIALNPKDALAYNNRAVANVQKGDLDAAIADYNKAIALNPKDALAYRNRGNAYFHKHDLDAAIADYNKAIALDPKDALAYYNQGNAYQYKGDLDAAIADYNKAIALNPKVALAYFYRASAYFQKKTLMVLLLTTLKPSRPTRTMLRPTIIEGILMAKKASMPWRSPITLKPSSWDRRTSWGIVYSTRIEA